MVEIKTEKTKITLPILITQKKNTQPLLRLNWLDKLEIGLQGSHETNVIRNITASEKGEKIFEEFENLFKKNHTKKDLPIDIQLKKTQNLSNKKGDQYPYTFKR